MNASGALLRCSREGLENLHGKTTLQPQELHHGSPCSADLIHPRARMGFAHLNSNFP